MLGFMNSEYKKKKKRKLVEKGRGIDAFLGVDKITAQWSEFVLYLVRV